jgi:DNA-binding PadR family transcriptional regulator
MDNTLGFQILRLLLEAGEENVPTILNTLLVQHVSEPPEIFLQTIGAILKSAEEDGYVQFTWYRDGWVPLTPKERHMVLPPLDSVAWDPAAKRWRWKEEELGPERPIVILTDKGEQYVRRQLRAEAVDKG